MRAAVLVSFGYSAALWALASHASTWAIAACALVGSACIDVFGVLWETALQQHIPSDVISRVSAYDLLGSFVMIPVAQAFVGPASSALGVSHTLLAQAALICGVSAAALLSRDVWGLKATNFSGQDLNKPPGERSK